MKRVAAKRKRITKKKAILLMAYVIYVVSILMFTIPYFSANVPVVEKTTFGERVTFTEDGSYECYRSVILQDKNMAGIIEFEYHMDSNILYIQKIENIQELVIDCKMLYEIKCEEVFGQPPHEEYYNSYFTEANDGLFTVVMNSVTPIEKLQFLQIPRPTSVLVDGVEWWDADNDQVDISGTMVTVTDIEPGSKIVQIYFKDVDINSPHALFQVSQYTAGVDVDITFDASASSDNDGEIEKYIWDFGDGTQNTGMRVTHAYANPGSYDAALTVKDNDFLEDTYILTINIE